MSTTKLTTNEAVFLAHIVAYGADMANTTAERRAAGSLAKKGYVRFTTTKAAIAGGYVMEVFATPEGKKRILEGSTKAVDRDVTPAYKTCRFCYTDSGLEYRECRRHPPLMSEHRLAACGDREGQWPGVHGNYWCGEYE